MQMYQSTPDYYRDYIEHGWLKDAAAKAHKYIDRWRGKNGKWYYRYKQELTDLKGRYRTRNGGRTYIDLDERENERGYSSSRARGDQIYGSRNAKNGWTSLHEVKGLSDHGNSRSYSKQGVNRGIEAGRKRAAKKGYAVTKGAYYSNKSKAEERQAKQKRKSMNLSADRASWNVRKNSNIVDMNKMDGKSKSYGYDSGSLGSRKVETTRVNTKSEKGRKNREYIMNKSSVLLDKKDKKKKGKTRLSYKRIGGIGKYVPITGESLSSR